MEKLNFDTLVPYQSPSVTPYPYPMAVISSSPKKFSDGIIIDIKGSGFLNLLNFGDNRVVFTDKTRSNIFSSRLENSQIINNDQILFSVPQDFFYNDQQWKGLNFYVTLETSIIDRTPSSSMFISGKYWTYRTSLSPDATYLLDF